MMDQQNRYTQPNSDTSPQSQRGEKPSIEEALSRGYNFGICEVISKAWEKTKGLKLKMLLAFIIMLALTVLWRVADEFIFTVLISPISTSPLAPIVMYVISHFLFTTVLTTFTAGIIGMTLNHYRNQPIEIGQVFKYFALFVPIFLYSIVSSLLTVIGLLLLIIPGIYLAIAYGLSIWLLIDNQALSFWDAMEASRKAITQHWFKFFFLGLVLGLIIIIAAIPLGIGLFWAMPLYFLSITVVYERIFGAR